MLEVHPLEVNQHLNEIKKLLGAFSQKFDATRVTIDFDSELQSVILSVMFTDFYIVRRAYSFGEITFSNIDLIGDFESLIEQHMKERKNAELDSRPQDRKISAKG